MLHLVQPPEFRSGVYEATIEGKTSVGRVECTPLTYLGGQADQPSLGGVFILKDGQNRPVYRVGIPPTPMARRRSVRPGPVALSRTLTALSVKELTRTGWLTEFRGNGVAF